MKGGTKKKTWDKRGERGTAREEKNHGRLPIMKIHIPYRSKRHFKMREGSVERNGR